LGDISALEDLRKKGYHEFTLKATDFKRKSVFEEDKNNKTPIRKVNKLKESK
jgi:hypothetical protein